MYPYRIPIQLEGLVMFFWDRFVLWLYESLSDVHPVGRDSIIRLYTLTQRYSYFSLAQLHDLSLLYLAALTGNHSAQHLIRAEVLSRLTLTDPEYIRQLHRVFLPPRTDDLVEMARTTSPEVRQMVSNTFLHPPGHELYSNLREFLGALLETDSNQIQEQTFAARMLLNALRHYLNRIPPGIQRFSSFLYGYTLQRIGQNGRQVPPTNTTDHPLRFDSSSSLDDVFRSRCRAWLNPYERAVIYMQFYGRLTAEEIAGVLRLANHVWTADGVARSLEQYWGTILRPGGDR